MTCRAVSCRPSGRWRRSLVTWTPRTCWSNSSNTSLYSSTQSPDSQHSHTDHMVNPVNTNNTLNIINTKFIASKQDHIELKWCIFDTKTFNYSCFSIFLSFFSSTISSVYVSLSLSLFLYEFVLWIYMRYAYMMNKNCVRQNILFNLILWFFVTSVNLERILDS